jgi:hypothetical protein
MKDRDANLVMEALWRLAREYKELKKCNGG